ncbi:MAG: hypothetical protein ACFB6S_18360 [Geminicoccaceae bacterium]
MLKRLGSKSTSLKTQMSGLMLVAIAAGTAAGHLPVFDPETSYEARAWLSPVEQTGAAATDRVEQAWQQPGLRQAIAAELVALGHQPPGSAIDRAVEQAAVWLDARLPEGWMPQKLRTLTERWTDATVKSARWLAASVSFEPSTDNTALDVRFAAEDPGRALEGANLIASRLNQNLHGVRQLARSGGAEHFGLIEPAAGPDETGSEEGALVVVPAVEASMVERLILPGLRHPWTRSFAAFAAVILTTVIMVVLYRYINPVIRDPNKVEKKHGLSLLAERTGSLVLGDSSASGSKTLPSWCQDLKVGVAKWVKRGRSKDPVVLALIGLDTPMSARLTTALALARTWSVDPAATAIVHLGSKPILDGRSSEPTLQSISAAADDEGGKARLGQTAPLLVETAKSKVSNKKQAAKALVKQLAPKHQLTILLVEDPRRLKGLAEDIQVLVVDAVRGRTRNRELGELLAGVRQLGPVVAGMVLFDQSILGTKRGRAGA